MSKVFTTAGATIGVVANTPATLTKAGFEALTYALVGEVTDFGEFGVVYELVTHNPIGTRRTVKRKGTKNNGSVDMVIGRDRSDAGQIVLLAGADGVNTDEVHSFEITLQNGDKIYFTGQVMSFTDNLGSVNNIVQVGCQIEIDDIVDAPVV
jgi:hypothetical protein